MLCYNRDLLVETPVLFRIELLFESMLSQPDHTQEFLHIGSLQKKSMC
jgi:hypothetical protein